MQKELWWMLLLYHLLPSIIKSLIILLIVYGIVKTFKIKNPAAQSFLYCLPLVKGYMGLLLGGGYVYDNYEAGFFHIGHLFDKNSLLFFYNVKINFFYWAVFIGIAVIFVINFARWIGILIFYSYLSYEAEVGRDETPEIYKILDELVPLFNVKYPKVILCHKKYATPGIIGFKEPKIIFSPNLLNELNKKDLKIIIAHELAHLRRYDYLLNWFTFALRDCQFFNPFAHLIYQKIAREKEKAADLLVVRKLRLKTTDIAETLSKVNAFLRLKDAPCLPPGTTGLTGINLTCMKDFANTTLYERIVFLSKNENSKSPSLKSKIALTVFAFVILLFNFSFAIPIAQKVVLFF